MLSLTAQTFTGASTVQELPAIARNPLVLFPTQAGVVARRTPLGDNSNRFQWDSPHRDFVPRIGLACKITDKIV